MNIRPEDLLRIKKELERESEPDNPIDQAMESAELIRENIAAIKGEQYLRLIEIGVLVQKAIELNAVLAHTAFDDGSLQLTMIGKIGATLGGKIVSHASMLYMGQEMSADEAKEMISWVERIANAEKAGIEQLVGGLQADQED
jgi:hypothetical protein